MENVCYEKIRHGFQNYSCIRNSLKYPCIYLGSGFGGLQLYT